jgi:hypothetical protein
MEAFKIEIAKDLGLFHKITEDGSYKGLTTLEVGQIGGEMVRRMQAAGEFAIKARFDMGEQRLMPPEVMPDPRAVREVTNNGNPTLHVTGDVHDAPASGQQFAKKDGKQDQPPIH